MKVLDYLWSKGKSLSTAKWECLVLDLTNRNNLGDNDSGLGHRDASFQGGVWKPQQKTWKKRLKEIFFWLKSKIMPFVVSAQALIKKTPLIIIQLGYWWWWWLTAEEKERELTAMKYKEKSPEQKENWTKWNKQLNELADELVKWLNETDLRWIFVVDQEKEKLKKLFPYQFGENLTEHDKDCLVLVWGFHEGKLNWIEEVKQKQGSDYYWNYCQKFKNYILKQRKLRKTTIFKNYAN